MLSLPLLGYRFYAESTTNFSDKSTHPTKLRQSKVDSPNKTVANVRFMKYYFSYKVESTLWKLYLLSGLMNKFENTWKNFAWPLSICSFVWSLNSNNSSFHCFMCTDTHDIKSDDPSLLKLPPHLHLDNVKST